MDIFVYKERVTIRANEDDCVKVFNLVEDEPSVYRINITDNKRPEKEDA